MDSDGKKCSDCRWWEEFTPPSSSDSGECYGGPPNAGLYPFTRGDEWCGQFLPPEHIIEAGEES